jgi:serine phosphatase RsbU (regulator of sigma subunit)
LFWRKSAGNVSEVAENGLFLGMFPEATYQSIQTPIAAGDRCVVYTDGVPEAKTPSQEEFGTARFKQFMESNQGLAAEQFAEGLLDELCRWSQQPRGEGQTDDITVLTIDFKCV